MARVVIRNGIASTSPDAAYPSGATTGVDISAYRSTPGLRCHILVDSTGGGATNAVIAVVYGYSSDAARWYPLIALNRGAGITPTTITPSTVADGNNMHYAERIVDVTGYDRLYVTLTSFTSTPTVTVAALFEH